FFLFKVLKRYNLSGIYLLLIFNFLIYYQLTAVAKADVTLQSSYRGAVTLRPIMVELIISDIEKNVYSKINEVIPNTQ
ncbi:MAG TPA: hypothetical protein VLN09_06365, partial [Psychrobacter sp.]|uniref:hypothetical protein n=1 Tax=Psychrobacter sp. TaxID=56811 RepID=UPI002C223FA3